MQEPSRPEELQAHRTLLDAGHKPNGRGWQMVRQGAMGLALVGVAGWLWKSASAEADKAGGRRAEKDRRGRAAPERGTPSSWGGRARFFCSSRIR